MYKVYVLYQIYSKYDHIRPKASGNSEAIPYHYSHAMPVQLRIGPSSHVYYNFTTTCLLQKVLFTTEGLASQKSSAVRFDNIQAAKHWHSAGQACRTEAAEHTTQFSQCVRRSFYFSQLLLSKNFLVKPQTEDCFFVKSTFVFQQEFCGLCNKFGLVS